MAVDPAQMINTLKLQLFHYDLDEDLKLAIVVIINMMRRMGKRFRMSYHILREDHRKEIERLAKIISQDVLLLEKQIRSGIKFCDQVRQQLHALILDMENGTSTVNISRQAEIWLRRMPKRMPTRHFSEERIFQTLADFYHQTLLQPVLDSQEASPKHPGWVVQATLTRLGFRFERLCLASKDLSCFITNVKRDWDRALQTPNKYLPTLLFSDLLEAASAVQDAEVKGLLKQVLEPFIPSSASPYLQQTQPTQAENISPFPQLLPTWEGFNHDTKPRQAFPTSNPPYQGLPAPLFRERHMNLQTFLKNFPEPEISPTPMPTKATRSQHIRCQSSSSTSTETPSKAKSRTSLAAKIKRGFRRRFSGRDNPTSSGQPESTTTTTLTPSKTSLERSFPIPGNVSISRWVAVGNSTSRSSVETARRIEPSSSNDDADSEARSNQANTEPKSARNRRGMAGVTPPRSLFKRKHTV